MFASEQGKSQEIEYDDDTAAEILQSENKEQRGGDQNGNRRANDQDRKLPGQIPGSGLCVISHKRKHSNKSCRIKNCGKDHPLGKRYIDDVHGQDTKSEPGRKEIRHNHQDKVDQQAEPDKIGLITFDHSRNSLISCIRQEGLRVFLHWNLFLRNLCLPDLYLLNLYPLNLYL